MLCDKSFLKHGNSKLLYCWLTLHNGNTRYDKKRKVRHSSFIFWHLVFQSPSSQGNIGTFRPPHRPFTQFLDIIVRALLLTSSLIQLKWKVIFLNVHLIWIHFTRSRVMWDYLHYLNNILRCYSKEEGFNSLVTRTKWLTRIFY